MRDEYKVESCRLSGVHHSSFFIHHFHLPPTSQNSRPMPKDDRPNRRRSDRRHQHGRAADVERPAHVWIVLTGDGLGHRLQCAIEHFGRNHARDAKRHQAPLYKTQSHRRSGNHYDRRGQQMHLKAVVSAHAFPHSEKRIAKLAGPGTIRVERWCHVNTTTLCRGDQLTPYLRRRRWRDTHPLCITKTRKNEIAKKEVFWGRAPFSAFRAFAFS